MTSPPPDPAAFRALFPALAHTVWLDTPGSPPGARPVTQALEGALRAWSSGDFDWHAWDSAAGEARTLFARLVGVDPTTVSTVGSVAEAAATVAASLPPGRIVVPAEDFRSNLFPWSGPYGGTGGATPEAPGTAPAHRMPSARHEVVAVPARDGLTRVEDLIEALDERVSLLAVSEVTSREGRRIDLAALRAATDRVGARLFVDLTQSLGALHFDMARIRPDHLAVHGYKWLLCPRGAAFLVTRPDRLGELRPIAPNWRSTSPPYGYFGAAELAPDAGRCDASPAWFSWIGAVAALRLMGSLDADQVERHCLGLAASLIDQVAAADLRPERTGPASHIAVFRAGRAERIARRLREHRVRATVLGDRVRFGFHYFNDERDVTTAGRALSTT